MFTWPSLMFLVESELFAEKQILGNQRTAGPDKGPQNPSHISKKSQEQSTQRVGKERDPVHWELDRMTLQAWL